MSQNGPYFIRKILFVREHRLLDLAQQARHLYRCSFGQLSMMLSKYSVVGFNFTCRMAA
jgi:hypothetical protein